MSMTKLWKREKAAAKCVYVVKRLNRILLFLPAIAKAVVD